jgi:hypothetical protein
VKKPEKEEENDENTVTEEGQEDGTLVSLSQKK